MYDQPAAGEHDVGAAGMAEARARTLEETRAQCAAAQARAAEALQRASVALATAEERLQRAQANQADFRRNLQRAEQILSRMRLCAGGLSPVPDGGNVTGTVPAEPVPGMGQRSSVG